jgi:hypothetical protein
MKKGSLVGKVPGRTGDFVIPAQAGIQSFFELFDL